MERTLILFKPDALQRGIAGRILSRFEEKGLKIAGLKLMRITPELAAVHYEAHREKPFYQGLVRFMTSAPVVTANWEADDSGDRWTVPIGGGAGRIFKIASVPNDVRIQAFGYLTKPENGPTWTLQFQWKVMFVK